MPQNKPFSMFLPPDVQPKDIPVLSLGKGFNFDTHYEGYFDGTGKYFLICECADDKKKDVQVHIIYFNKKEMVLEQRILSIKYENGDYTNRRCFFKQKSGNLYYVIETKSSGKLNAHIYHYDISKFLETNIFGVLKTSRVSSVINGVFRKPDFTLQYSLEDYNKLDYQINKDASELIVKAFHATEIDLTDQFGAYTIDRFQPKCQIDVLHLVQDNQLYHSLSKELNLTNMNCFNTETGDPENNKSPWLLLTKDYFYFYNDDDDDDDFRAFYVVQFNIDGTLKHTYKLTMPNFEIFLGPEVEVLDEQRGLFFHICLFEGGRRTYLFRDGKVSLVNEAKDFKSDYLKDRLVNCESNSSEGSITRFGRKFFPLYILEDPTTYYLLDANGQYSDKELIKFDLDNIEHETSINWNLKEVGVTSFLQRHDDPERKDLEMFFGINHIEHPETKPTLKHLARIAVLTSFSEQCIKEQPLPSHLLTYLGIEMKKL